ncbi:cephalosporin hydroxylase family protein [Sodalinema gerasimenkoae]|uniref:cephalosporin hydroxylase family protein n=1 Tax=Sodalinema gerasimenkoae TaxID=2862348 RepID=UPI0024838EA3|nr:CmcI family methyltransferase [Sodalinema gerasimenkoae]
MIFYDKFKRGREQEIQVQGTDTTSLRATKHFFDKANSRKSSYHFEWLVRPIIQYPQDIVAMQEIIWSVQPELIIETGIVHKSSLIFSASMLELNAACGGHQDAEVLGIDIDIRKHNRQAIESYCMFKRISIISGSILDLDIIEQVKMKASGKQSVLVCLDSNHTHDHLPAELEAYAPLVTLGTYWMVFDESIGDFPDDMFPDSPWGLFFTPQGLSRSIWRLTLSLKLTKASKISY